MWKTLTIAASLCACAAVPADADADANALGWLSGCWEHEDGGTQESWTADYGGLLFGHAVTVRDGAVVAFEDLRIQPGPEGLSYVASPGGQGGTAFTEAERTASGIVFLNADHDFPQRIAYRREGDTLTAEIALADGSNAMAFAMRPC